MSFMSASQNSASPNDSTPSSWNARNANCGVSTASTGDRGAGAGTWEPGFGEWTCACGSWEFGLGHSMHEAPSAAANPDCICIPGQPVCTPVKTQGAAEMYKRTDLGAEAPRAF